MRRYSFVLASLIALTRPVSAAPPTLPSKIVSAEWTIEWDATRAVATGPDKRKVAIYQGKPLPRSRGGGCVTPFRGQVLSVVGSYVSIRVDASVPCSVDPSSTFSTIDLAKGGRPVAAKELFSEQELVACAAASRDIREALGARPLTKLADLSGGDESAFDATSIGGPNFVLDRVVGDRIEETFHLSGEAGDWNLALSCDVPLTIAEELKTAVSSRTIASRVSEAAPVTPQWTEPSEGQAGSLTSKVIGGKPFHFSQVPAGTFLMGAPSSDKEAGEEERPLHKVTLTRPFLLMRTEVTREQFEAIMGLRSAQAELPLDGLKWDDAIRFCNRLSELDGLPAAYDEAGAPIAGSTGYRLPTEAEWEYAARAGTTAPRYGKLADIGWNHENASDPPQPGAMKQPNAWMLFDTLGNVAEWTSDWFTTGADTAYAGAVTDPTGAAKGFEHVARGGAINDRTSQLRAAARAGARVAGIRVARALP